MFAQYTHAPAIGTIIEFYPVCDSVRNLYKGYDCFYNDKAYDGSKLKDKAKFRLFSNKDKLTPYNEIEGHSFTVERTRKYSPTGKLADELYLMFLKREDGIQVIFRLPFQPKDTDNGITKDMVTKYVNETRGYTTTITIPYIAVDTLLYAQNNLVGKDRIRYVKDGDYKGDRIQIRNNGKLFYYLVYYIGDRENRNGNKIPPSLFYNGTRIHVNSIEYRNVPTYTFKQPFANFIMEGKTFFLPLQDYYGKGRDNQLSNYKFQNLFSDAEGVISGLQMQLPSDTAKYYKDLNLYYGMTKEFSFSNKGIHLMDSKERFELRKGWYKFNKFALIPTTEKLSISAIVSDSLGNGIVIPAASKHKDIGNIAYNFFEAFSTKEEFDSILTARHNQKVAIEQRRKEYEQSIADAKAKIIKKYGKKYGEYYLGLSEYDKEKFEKAHSKWGASIAKDIVEGYVRIGWDREKCRMSWGEPRDINTSIGAWGRHEQWCYYSSYLYFENGRLTSIQQ